MQQSRGALPTAPMVVMVHIASVWVPFTSESKEAIAHYPEIMKEVQLAAQDFYGVYLDADIPAELTLNVIALGAAVTVDAIMPAAPVEVHAIVG